MIIKYGIRNNAIDVTSICFIRLNNNGIVTIPSGDLTRSYFFTDPFYGIHKKIFITDNENNTSEFNSDLIIKLDIINNKIISVNYSNKYTAIIIEPRKHKAFEFVLNNFIKNLSDEWDFIIFHGNQNEEYIKKILEKMNDKDRIRIFQMINLHIDNLNYDTYSDILKNESFYNYIPTDIFLIFQTDSIILSENKNLLNTFINYDYVGAPWSWFNDVGNGGLSLRNKNKMLEIIKKKGYNKEWEDIYFARNPIIPLNKPSFDDAKVFSVESVFYKSPFGIHNCWKHLTQEEMDYYTETYPEIQTLINLQ